MIDNIDIFGPKITNLKSLLDYALAIVGLILTTNLFLKNTSLKIRNAFCRITFFFHKKQKWDKFKRLRINKFDNKFQKIFRGSCFACVIIILYTGLNIIRTPNDGSLISFKKGNVDVVLFKDKIISKRTYNPLIKNWILTNKDCASYRDSGKSLNKNIPPEIIDDACEILLNKNLKPAINNSIEKFQKDKPIILSLALILIIFLIWISSILTSSCLISPALKDLKQSRKIREVSSFIRVSRIRK
ncbi:hypothetical protein [Rosenbergiella australiborealis]|uniref:hypothetical protein n=1 Tax=Rosenbergiella australiborealis TaxID=1544696 RepID=UPI001F4E2488|nr:hypothetical protein [Rosenbergiella australiborealis]